MCIRDRLVRGRGMQVEDAEGRTYLDFVSGVGAVSLGHCHPALASAIEEQASTLVHVSNYYYIEHRGEVAHLVSDLLNECVDEGERTPVSYTHLDVYKRQVLRRTSVKNMDTACSTSARVIVRAA